MKIYLNIGTNSGDRRANIVRAVAAIVYAFPGCRSYLSAPVASAPWGYESPNEFLNIGMMLLTPYVIDPHEVLRRTQAVEGALCTMPHRNRDGSYRDRDLDIDIIAIDNIHLASPTLTLPHPRATLRPFVMGPMADLGAEDLFSARE